jgi:NAD(P)-dependent dehydrogenase (short-subunit alcohol dehydrogenase family)
MSEARPVAVVTGASRGLGQGVAIALGAHGCIVYVTGRTRQVGEHVLAGTIYETAEAVTAAGGVGIPVAVDHASDEQEKALFAQVEREQGRLDILVNNAAAVHTTSTEPGAFWEKPIAVADLMEVGLRSSYVCTWLAAPMFLRQKKGLVIFTGSQGGVVYMLGPAYGAHKAGHDKFAADMAVDFKDHGVACVSIWAGGVLTERLRQVVASDPVKYAGVLESAETPEFTGHVVWAMFQDPNIMDITGQAVIGAEMAVKYGVKDEGGRQPPSMRDTQGVKPRIQPWPKFR